MVTVNSSRSACTLSNTRTLYTDIKGMSCSFVPFLHSLNKEHSLGTQECQANGMLVLSIISIHKVVPRSPPDVTSYIPISACVQVVY